MLTKATPISLGEALQKICHRIDCQRDPEGIAVRRPLPRRTPRQVRIAYCTLWVSSVERRLAHEHGREALRLSAHFVFQILRSGRAAARDRCVVQVRGDLRYGDTPASRS